MKIEEELESSFPGLRVTELEFHNLLVRKSDPRFEEFKKRKQNEIREKIRTLEEVKDIPIFRAYRDFYWKVGVDPTKTRPAGEALTRRILSGKDLPTINTLVDAYNLASTESGVAIAAFDLSSISEIDLRMRRAKHGEPFLGIGMKRPITLEGIEVVIEDRSNLIAVYPYRDSDSSKVTEASGDVLMMMCGVPGVNDGQLENARTLTQKYVGEYCEFSKDA